MNRRGTGFDPQPSHMIGSTLIARMPWFGPAPSTSWTLGRSFPCTRHWNFVTIPTHCSTDQYSQYETVNDWSDYIFGPKVEHKTAELDPMTLYRFTIDHLKGDPCKNYTIQWLDFCFVFWWQAWAQTESGVIRSCAAYCIDRFQRYAASRLDMDDAT